MNLEDLKSKLLADSEVRGYYEELKPEFEIARQLIRLRRELGLSQRDLAAKAGIKQPQLARIETGKQSPRLDTIVSIASSVGYSVEVNFVPNHAHEGSDTEVVMN